MLPTHGRDGESREVYLVSAQFELLTRLKRARIHLLIAKSTEHELFFVAAANLVEHLCLAGTSQVRHGILGSTNQRLHIVQRVKYLARSIHARNIRNLGVQFMISAMI